MKKTNKNFFSCRGWDYDENGAAESIKNARLVWKNAPQVAPKEGGQLPGGLSGFEEEMRNKLLNPEEKLADGMVSLDEILGTEHEQIGAVSRLAEVWDKTWDQLNGFITLLFGKPVSRHVIESAIRSGSVTNQLDEEEEARKNPLPPITVRGGVQVSQKNFNSAKHAAEKLKSNANLQRFVKTSSERWGFSYATLASFVEIESSWNTDDTPTYLDLKTDKKVHAKNEQTGLNEKRILSRDEQERRGLKLTSSAHGLAQVMQYDAPKYIRERYDAFTDERRKRGETGPIPEKDDPELFYNPEVAIDFMGWHLKNKVNEVATFVERSKSGSEAFPDHYKQIEGDMKWLYLSYNSGAYGYLVARRYMDSVAQGRPQTEIDRNKERLVWFQKRDYKDKNGNSLGLEALVRARTGDKAAQVVKAFESFLN